MSAADLVALLGNGSFRDALGVLQKVLTAVDAETISADDVARITGAPSGTVVNTILQALGSGDHEGALGAIAEANTQGISMKLLAELILHKLRAVLMLRFAPTSKAVLSNEYNEADMELLERLAKEGKNINSACIVRFLDASAHIDRSSIPSLPLELAVVGE